jgi:D-hexose-6-phosphate mutarotase
MPLRFATPCAPEANYRCPSRSRTAAKSLSYSKKPSTYIDKTDGFARKLQPDAPIRIGKETDQVHLNTTAACTISDPAWSRRIVIRKTGSNSTVVWNPWIAKTAALPDMAPDEWQGMICVETANVADNALTLAPGDSHQLTAAISLEN